MEDEFAESVSYLRNIFNSCKEKNLIVGGHGFYKKFGSEIVVDRFGLETFCKINAREMNLYPPIKNFYIEDPLTAAMTPNQVKRWRRRNNNVTIRTGLLFDTNPVIRFYDAFKVYPAILEIVRRANLAIPTPIQSQTWPLILQGHDCLGLSQTGSGKTLAYLLPAFIHILGQSVYRQNRLGPNILIISPTWELADNICYEIEKFEVPTIKTISITGGGDRENQISNLNEFTFDIVVGTAGRLNDLMLSGHLVFTSFTYIVVDDAYLVNGYDFDTTIFNYLFNTVRGQQVLLFSSEKPNILEHMTINPMTVEVKRYNTSKMSTTKQRFIFAHEADIVQDVYELLLTFNTNEKTVVFCGMEVIDQLYELLLNTTGLKYDALQGVQDPKYRENIITEMIRGDIRILLITPKMAWSLHILNDVTKIINVEFPRTFDEYVYRINRLSNVRSRAERVTTFFTGKRCYYIKDVIKVLRLSNQIYPEQMNTLDTESSEDENLVYMISEDANAI